MVGIAWDAASEYLGIVGVYYWLDDSVPAFGGLGALNTQLKLRNSRLM